MQKVFVNEILYIGSWKDYVKLFFTAGETILVKQSINSMEKICYLHTTLYGFIDVFI